MCTNIWWKTTNVRKILIRKRSQLFSQLICMTEWTLWWRIYDLVCSSCFSTIVCQYLTKRWLMQPCQTECVNCCMHFLRNTQMYPWKWTKPVLAAEGRTSLPYSSRSNNLLLKFSVYKGLANFLTDNLIIRFFNVIIHIFISTSRVCH